MTFLMISGGHEEVQGQCFSALRGPDHHPGAGQQDCRHGGGEEQAEGADCRAVVQDRVVGGGERSERTPEPPRTENQRT